MVIYINDESASDIQTNTKSDRQALKRRKLDNDISQDDSECMAVDNAEGTMHNTSSFNLNQQSDSK